MDKKLKILVIDDEPDILELIAEAFHQSGHNVCVANCGNAAIEILKETYFDAIVCDFKMPNGNGMVVLNFVNTLQVRPLFYFVSAQADVSIAECLQKGAKKFIPKPFNFDELLLIITSDFVPIDPVRLAS